MIAAALDLGSNTLRLLVADVNDGRWQALDRGLASPRLGRDLKPGASLSERAKQDALKAAAGFTAKARELGAERVALAATQACRQAADGAQFVARLQKELGLDWAGVISGAEEAALSRRGVLSRFKGGADAAVGAWLTDIGGGSTEIMDLGDPAAPVMSLELGAVSLTEAHLRGDPPAPGELKAMQDAIANGLAPIISGWQGLKCKRLVATAGTAATLAALCLGMRVYEPEEINNLQVTKEDLEAHYSRLAAMPLAQRRRELALEPARADIIVAGLAILSGLVQGLDLKSFITMDAGLLEGILLERAAIS
jgi:exopolyphosphatase/guanosine-5'-triphosphate,3'-diphosphate pyrophosphatase